MWFTNYLWEGANLFKQLPLLLQLVLSSLDATQGVHEEGSAEDVYPTQAGWADAVGDADDQVSHTDPEKHLTDAVQMCDSGIDVRVEFEGAKFSRLSVIMPLEYTAHVFHAGLS